jgi:hypothetical protein
LEGVVGKWLGWTIVATAGGKLSLSIAAFIKAIIGERNFFGT